MTQDVHFNAPTGDNTSANARPSVSCPTGKQAINGGILKSTADPPYAADATAAEANGGFARAGSAGENQVAENGDSAPPGSVDPTNPVVFNRPRASDDGHSWLMDLGVFFPRVRATADSPNTFYGITVTVYVICM